MIDSSGSKIGDSVITGNETYNFKILIIGEEGVGKTSLKIRYTEDKFDPSISANTFLDFKTKVIQLNQTETAALSIWDTAGSEKFHSIAKSYLNNSQGILLCFDISNRKSFEELNNFWISFIEEYIEVGKQKKEKISLVFLVGNKKDLSDKREISIEEAQRFAETFHGKYYETSSLTGEGIHLLFQEFTLRMVVLLEQNKLNYLNPNDTTKLLGDTYYNSDSESKRRTLIYDKDGGHMDTSRCC